MEENGSVSAVLTEEEKRRALYLRQKHMLEGFLARGAISPAQLEKSLGDLTVKMGMEELRAADDAGAAENTTEGNT